MRCSLHITSATRSRWSELFSAGSCCHRSQSIVRRTTRTVTDRRTFHAQTCTAAPNGNAATQPATDTNVGRAAPFSGGRGLPPPKVVFKPTRHIYSPLESERTPRSTDVTDPETALQTYWPNGFVPTLIRPLPWLRTEQPPVTAAPWQLTDRRAGVLAVKCGMMSLFSPVGVRFAVTVLQVDSTVVGIHQPHRDNPSVWGLRMGLGRKKLKKVRKPQMVEAKKNGVFPPKQIVSFPVSAAGVLPVGYTMRASHFIPGQYVDVRSKTIGKGFAGGMKRWNFGGQNASHGVSLSHRSIGATGSRQDPGRVFKNKKMPGRLGHKFRTTQNIQLYKIDPARNLLFLKGAISGPTGTIIQIKDAVKRPFDTDRPPPFPTIVTPESDKELIMESDKIDPFAYGGV